LDIRGEGDWSEDKLGKERRRKEWIAEVDKMRRENRGE